MHACGKTHHKLSRRLDSVISYGSAGSGVLLGWSAVNRYELLFKKEKCKQTFRRNKNSAKVGLNDVTDRNCRHRSTLNNRPMTVLRQLWAWHYTFSALFVRSLYCEG
jgi:hypothetical protein